MTKNKSKKQPSGAAVPPAPASASAPGPANDAPPAYGFSAAPQNPETTPATQATMSPEQSSSRSPPSEKTQQSARQPTADAPFDFPSNVPPPSYVASTAASAPAPIRPIAVPQSSPVPSAAFLPAYAPVLLARGIPAPSWHAFLATLSAFLSASVSDRALAHASDVARRAGDRPVGYAKNLTAHVQRVGRGVAQDARGGNVLGAASKLVGGAISIPLHAAVGAVATAVSLPGTVLSAAAQTPQTPRARAAAYLVVANRDWLAARGLHAELLNSRELSQLVGASVTSVADAARGSSKKQGPNAQATIQLKGLEDYIEELEVAGEGVTLELGDSTLWLVLRQSTEESGSVKTSTAKA